MSEISLPTQTMTKTVLRDDESRRITVYGRFPKDKVKIKNKVKLLLASGAQEKFQDWDRALKELLVNVTLVNQVIALEDSEEVEDNAVDISMNKILITLINGLKELSDTELEQVYEKLGVSGASEIVGLAEDRFLRVDKRLRDHSIFQPYKNDPLLAEIFEEEAEFPDHRIKELTTAMGGPVEFLHALKQAYEDLPQIDPVKYADLNRNHESGIAVALRPLAEGNKFLDKDGIVIEVVGKKNRLDYASQKRLGQLREKGKDHDLDTGCFEYSDGHQSSTAEMRLNHKDGYFDKDCIIADVRHTLETYFDLPRRAAERSLSPIVVKNPTLLSDTNLNLKKLSQIFGENVGVNVHHGEIKSLADLEQSGIHTHGIVLNGKRKKYKNDPLKRAIRKVEFLLRFAAFATLKTVYDPFHDGEPMLVHESRRGDVMPILNEMNGRKTIPMKPSMICDFYDATHELCEKLVWDPRYQAPENLPKPDLYQLCSETEFFDSLGIEKPKVVIGTVASASLNAPAALYDADTVSYELARCGVSQINGGSSRHLMAEPTYAAVRAYKEGCRGFTVIGSREVAISAREGGIKRLLNQTGFEVTQGTINDEVFRIGDFLHFREFKNLAERQHPILGASDALVQYPGGVGTLYETLAVMLSNLYIALDKREKRAPENQRNFFPGFERKIRHIFAVNSRINGDPDQRYIDYMKEIFTSKELELAGVSFHDDGHEALDAIKAHFADKGIVLKPNKPVLAA
ncbi:MAG: hypothetical protein MRY79_00745 [Alphaproteobacteria bacterium]|nr:hypothetical protein [Alphaproteobacteria bacterium]